VAQGVADGAQVTDETGMAPIPPLNLKLASSAAAGSEIITPRNIVQASAFFMMGTPPHNIVLLDVPAKVVAKL
jgi:hypothetical protein